MLKNWCFQTVVLEETLESPLDSKEIKPVNPKGNQPWISIGRTCGAVPILWPPRCEELTHWKRPWCWETIALNIGTFVSKVMSLLFNMLSSLVIAFLPRMKFLWISWLQSLPAVIWESKKIKSVTVSTLAPSIWSDGTGCYDLSFLNVEL